MFLIFFFNLKKKKKFQDKAEMLLKFALNTNQSFNQIKSC